MGEFILVYKGGKARYTADVVRNKHVTRNPLVKTFLNVEAGSRIVREAGPLEA